MKPIFISTLMIAAIVFTSLSCKRSTIQRLMDHDDHEPVATLDQPIYSGSNTAINNAATAELALSYTNAANTTLTASTGTTSSPPTGLTISTTGGVSCSSIEIVSPTTAGANIEVSGCTGDGSVLVTVQADTAQSLGHLSNAASAQRTVLVQNTRPTAGLVATHTIVGTTNGANIITATFASRVRNLDPANANSEFLVSGCATPPSVAIGMSVNGSGHSIATATLSGGTCSDGNTVTVELQRNRVTDLAGNAGLAGSNPSETYDIDTTAPVANLAAAVYPATQGALRGAQTATLALTFTNAASQTLAAGSGSTSTPPAGLTVTANGTANCTIAIATPSTAGATLSVSGCSGDGSVEVEVNAAIATSAGGLTNAASSQRIVWIQTTPPLATFAGTPPVGGTDGSNTLTATFSNLVEALSLTNLNGQVVVTGCATTPTVSIVMSDDGNGHSIATLNLSGGVCNSGDPISVQLHLENITDQAGNTGLVTDNPAPENYTAL